MQTQKNMLETVRFKTFNPWYRTMQIMSKKNQIYQNCTQSSANKKYQNFPNLTISQTSHTKKIPSNVPHELENVNFI